MGKAILMTDLIIRGGTIIDGSGAPSYRGDVAVKDGIIDFIGRLDEKKAAKIIEADGLVVSPGFIDMHSHDDLHLLENPAMEAKIRQGVTSTVIGNCGFGLYPVLPENKKLFHEYAAQLFGEPEKGAMGYEQLEDFFTELKSLGSALNVASLVAHGVLRVAVMGFENRPPNEFELQKMKELLRQSLRSGAQGMSLGLIYPPGSYADTKELIELSQVVADEGGILTSHMRNEAQYLLESIEEMLVIARATKVPLEISHLKASGIPNFGKGKEALKIIAQAKMEGVDVTFDQYPYPAGSTTATILLPPWSLEGGTEKMLERIREQDSRHLMKKDMMEGISGSSWEPRWRIFGWDKILICSVKKSENKQFEGQSVKEITDRLQLDPCDFILDLLEKEDGQFIMITFQQDRNDLEEIMVHDLQMFGTDGLPLRGRKAHPRLYGTYPKILGTYVRDNNLLSLERAIFKMCYMPANRLGLLDRGLLRPGMAADITIFDKNTVAERSTYTNPAENPEGIISVIVNGVVVMEEGKFTGKYPGRALRKTRQIDEVTNRRAFT